MTRNRTDRSQSGLSDARPDQQEAGTKSGGGCARFSILLFATWGLFAFLLRGFVSTKSLIFLSVPGAVLLCAGIYLAIKSARRITSLWYLGLFIVGLAMILGAIATLLPASPDNLLIQTTTGWNILERRADLLEEAIQKENISLARRLARRGLGDSEPLNSFGRPLIHDSKSGVMIAALLDGTNLDPNARDLDGCTLLMNTYDEVIARVLLDAGADPNARSKDGYTALMMSAGKSPEFIRTLLQKGADVHAVDENGEPVATYFGIDDKSLKLLEEYAGGRPLIKESNPLQVGYEEWLVIYRDPSAKIERSSIQTDPSPLRYGDVARVHVHIGNDSNADRKIRVKTTLNQAVLFVDASHKGEIENKKQPQLNQTIRWPVLALPAHSQGRLALRVVARSDEKKAGDAVIDVEIREMDGTLEQLNLYQTPQKKEQRLAAPGASCLIPVLFLIVVAISLIVLRRLKESALSKAEIVSALVAVFCIGTAILFMLSIIDPFIRFEEATCTILDRRYLLQSQSTGGSRKRGSSRRRGSTVYSVPITAVRIDSNGESLITTGFSTHSHSVDELRRFPLGSSVRCWVFPDDRSIFTLTREPGTGFIFAIGFLVLTAIGLIVFVWRSAFHSGD